jgi:hypothetical protein
MPKATFGKSCAKKPLLESHFLEKLHKNVTNDKVRFLEKVVQKQKTS